MSFKLPPEVTVKQEEYQGKVYYVLRHNQLGELGRLVISAYMGQTHISCEVVGDESDPLTQVRREILLPITNSMIEEVENKLGNPITELKPPQNHSHGVPSQSQTIEAQFLPCLKCRANVAHIIYSYASTPGEIEDTYRMMYSKLPEVNLPTWIVGDQNSITGQVLVLKSWPERLDAPKWVLGDKFDAQIRNLQGSHCSQKKEPQYQ